MYTPETYRYQKISKSQFRPGTSFGPKISWLVTYMIFSNQRLTKALLRLRECADWFAPLLFANPPRQVFSYRGPIYLCSSIVLHAQINEVFLLYVIGIWTFVGCGVRNKVIRKSLIVMFTPCFKTVYYTLSLPDIILAYSQTIKTGNLVS